MKQTVEEAAKECRRTTAQSMGVYAQYHSIDECPNHGITYDEIAEAAFIKGVEWQAKQASWISVEDAIPNKQAKGMCQVKFVDGSIDEMAYRHASPFSTVSPVLGPFQCFMKGNRCFYDETLPLKEDYDMTLQQLNLERVILRVNAYHYVCKQSVNEGGCASYRNREREKQQIEALCQKWGSDIVKLDTTNKGHSKKKKLDDYNTIIHIPIKGI